jgi:HEAT repeat protein
MKDVQAIEPLIRKLGAKSNIRCAAARALANLGQPKWLQWIRGSENDFNHLWASADSEAKGLLFNTIELSVDAVRTLGTCGDPRAFESLVRALSAGDGDARCAAAKALGKIGDRRAAEPLARALEDCSPLVRERASVALFRIGDSRAIEPLRRLLTTAGKEVVEVLEEVGGSHALDLLPVALRNNKPEVRCRAVRALGKLGDRAALDPLVSALSDPDGDVRRLTVEALAQFDASRAVEPVLRMLSDERSDIRQQAAEVLGQLGDSRAVDPLIAQLCDWRIYRDNERECCSIIDALSKLGDQRAVEPLVRMLGERTSGSRVPRSAAAALATLGHPKWLQWVCGEFDTDFERLGRSEDADACAPLVFALDCPRFSVRMAAARALGMLGEERAVKPLLDCLRGAHGTWDTRLVGEVFRGGSASWCLRKAVATALVQICSRNPRAVAPHWAALAQAVREPHVDSHKDIAGQSDCGTDIHQDRGIGLDFPAPPPGATRPPSVADAATKQAVPKEPVIVCQNPQCQKKFKFAAKLAGRVVKCPACGTSFKVPAQQGGGHDARLDF